ncbi:MAG: PspA/IM30 family protein, partial [Deltaproteobacteria bacterium]|nr:PspA/IM30 family protein [Deltaproteobacteria bacterium]
QRAEAQKKIQATMHGLAENSAFAAFDRMAEKVDRMEAEAEAQSELVEHMSGDSLARQFDQLDQTSGADDALSALKAKMGLLPAATEPRLSLEDLEELEAISAGSDGSKGGQGSY